jgi:uncharacterized protein (TIGR02453 family)
MAGFPGFTPEALKFLKALKKNNTREWFQPRKEDYERLWRTPMIDLVTALQAEVAKIAPELAGQDPAKAVMRIYRDTRFSKDKTPYKTWVAASLGRGGGMAKGGGGLYFHVGEEGAVIAGGIYAPSPEELRAVREYLSEHYEQFRKMIGAAKFKSLMGELQGETLTRVPKGFDCAHPAEDLLRKKQFYFHITLGADLVTTSALYSEMAKRLKSVVPVVEFMNVPILGLAKAKDSRFLSDFA